MNGACDVSQSHLKYLRFAVNADALLGYPRIQLAESGQPSPVGPAIGGLRGELGEKQSEKTLNQSLFSLPTPATKKTGFPRLRAKLTRF